MTDGATSSATRAPEREPIECRYRGLTVYGMGPPSSGGIDRRRGAQHPRRLRRPPARRATEILHRYLEASRYAFADRNAYLADPAFFDVPVAGPDLDVVRRRAARADHRRGRRRSPVAPGDPYDNQGGAVAGARPSAATISHPRQSTTHLTVADRKGNVVSYTFTIESTGGNGIVVPGYGFLLNNELTDFNFDSTTHPNRAEGGKRPRSSMAPTIIERDGKPYLAVGSPGGSTIPGTVLQTLVNRIDLRRAAAERDRAAAGGRAQHARPRRPSRRSSTRRRALALAGAAGTRSRRPPHRARSAPRPAIEIRRRRLHRRRRAGAPRRRHRGGRHARR